jgi:predicted molibdopterin-dependent oxidoreductase YjgC
MSGGGRRIEGDVLRGAPFEFLADGEPVRAYPGETVAAALLAAGRRRARTTTRRAEPRGVYCGMGVCFECLIVVDGRPNLRACTTPAAPGMRVETQHGPGGRFGTSR